MEDAEEKRVPIAYVTKWVGCIVVMRNVRYGSSNDRLWTGWSSIASKDWTTNKEEAEKRYRKKLEQKKINLMKNIKKIEAQLTMPPVYRERAR